MRGAIESSPLEKNSGLDFVPVFTIGYQSAIAIPDLKLRVLPSARYPNG
jgi:hypothetical protein